MIKSFFILFLLVGLCVAKTLACDCVSAGAFLQAAKNTPFVALVKVTRYLTFKNTFDSLRIPTSMEVEIIDSYKGKDVRKTVVVWGNLGILCREYVSTFKVGQHYVIAFVKANNFGGGHPCEKDTDYSISNCGTYWLIADITQWNASGIINSNDGTKGTITLSNLRNKLL